tara:strand:+ start:708 stop:1442 length:735 start_codon:yes stop_codon:yes gene_type:complete
MNSTIEILKNHKSIRKYTDKAIEDHVLEELIEAGQWASTSSYVQAYSVIRVKDKDKREAMAVLSGDQKNVRTAPEFLVFCADLNRLNKACELHDIQMQDGFIELLLIASVDAALMAQNVMIAAESLGLGGVYVGGLRNDPEQMSSLLGLPDRVYPVFGLCLGWPDQNPDQKPRLSKKLVYFEDTYQEPDLAELQSYDEVVKAYYIERTKGKIDHSWTEQMSEKLSKETRPHMLQYLKNKKFAQR